MKRLHGIHLPFRITTDRKPIEPLPLPKLIRLPMLMHNGIPCEPVVQPGDTVLAGQCIGRAPEGQAAPIHASVSGTVTALSDIHLPGGEQTVCVEIKPDGKQLLSADCKPPELNNKDDLIAAAKASGCVGLSGAGVPTHCKLAADTQYEILIVNGAECEPHLTADARLMTENPRDIVEGAALILKLLKIKEARIGIMTDKPAAIKEMADACESHSNINICPLPPLYPQGAEKVLVFHTCGRVIPEHQTAADQHILVLNAATCAFLYQYSLTGIPLIERIVTVSGDAVRRPCNLRVPVGTPVKALLDRAKCDYDSMKLLLCGDVMMGTPISDLQMPLLKQQNGLIAMKAQKQKKRTNCIRCGRCRDACPMRLMPMQLAKDYAAQNTVQLERHHVSLCMNCGCCSYVCPAHIPLAQLNQRAIALLPEANAAKGAAE